MICSLHILAKYHSDILRIFYLLNMFIADKRLRITTQEYTLFLRAFANIPFARIKRWMRKRYASMFREVFQVVRKQPRTCIQDFGGQVVWQNDNEKGTQNRALRKAAEDWQKIGHLVQNYNNLVSIIKIRFAETE